MKKILALALILVLVLALCACGGKDGPDGTYRLTGIRIDGKDYSDYISTLGYDSFEISFRSDGTGALTGDGSNIPFTWDEAVLDDGVNRIPYTYADDAVRFEARGMEMTFTR